MNYKKKPAAPPGVAELHRKPRPLLRAALIVAVYLFAFIILDFFSQQFEELRGIVAWYPPAGLTYTLLLVFGVRFAPAVTIALFIGSLFIYRMPQPPYLLFLWAFIISLIYSIAAAVLREGIHFDWQLRKLRDVTWLVVTSVFVSALLALLSVLSSALSSDMPRSEVLSAIFRWWIGETVGVLTVTPFLLMYVMPGLKRFAEGQPVRLPARRSFPRPTLSAIGQASSLAFTLYWVFGTRVLNEFQPLFLITLPLIWIALQHGFKGVTVAIVALNFGVVFALWFFRFDLARLAELQLLMIVNCIVGLLMGAVVTERKQAEATLKEYSEHLSQIVDERTHELRETQEQLVQHEKLAVLGQLAGGVGHELRNPLGVILNAVYYLRLVQPDADDKIRQYHGLIEQEVRSAEKIVTDLLDFARIKSVDREAVSVSDLIRQTLERFPAPPTVEVTLEIPADLPRVHVDLRQMTQVLGNLTVNACQAMKDGGQLIVSSDQLSVNGNTSTSLSSSQWVRIAVKDTGVGISPENMKKLFEPLFTTKTKGIGLGLAVSQKLIEANGGRIEVESEPGVGTTFTVFLPLQSREQ
jgi:signal transduction histidine kinase